MKIPGSKRYRAKAMSGVTLIEVAIAILILSIGALGLAGLQISAKRAGFEAIQRTDAQFLAMDILERMRGNASVISEYVTAGVGEGTGSALGAAPVACTAAGVSCAASAIRARDMWEWEAAINGSTAQDPNNLSVGGLVRPVGCITVGTNRLVTVEIAWQGFEVPDPNSATGCGSAFYADGNRQTLQMTSFIGSP